MGGTCVYARKGVAPSDDQKGTRASGDCGKKENVFAPRMRGP